MMDDASVRELAWTVVEAMIFKGPDNEQELHNLSILLDPNPCDEAAELLPTVLRELVAMIAESAADQEELVRIYTKGIDNNVD